MAARKVTDNPSKRRSRAKKSGSDSDHQNAVKVRMYRQGLGDCFLVALPRQNSRPYYIMIDCGVILGAPGAAAIMEKVANDILATTQGHVDLLLATHEHWDHLSGFVQARNLLTKLQVDNVWLAWTEDPTDELAKKLRTESHAMRMALASATARMRFAGRADPSVEGLLEFFGASGQGTTTDALNVVKSFCARPRYCLPNDDPVKLEGVDARLYVLGPPHDEKLIKKFNPSKSQPETYEMAETGLAKIAPAITQSDLSAPFDPIVQIPIEAARQMPFFQEHYWGEESNPRKSTKDGIEGKVVGPGKENELDQSWRRIDGDWLGLASDLALQLDSATNNTSVALAIELGNGKVLLFVADAQVGNWLSWQTLSWEVDGKNVTGPDLLSRTILYKTGHHGSHNATLQEKGLELMKKLEIALIPVDHDMAVKKRWGNMPLPSLEKRLNEITNGRVLRIDRDVPPKLNGRVSQDTEKKLYYEVTL